MLGTIDQRHLIRLLEALQTGQAGAVLEIADELATRGLSYRAALADLAILLSRIAIVQRVAQAVDEADPIAADIKRLASALQPDAVQLFYTVAVHSRSELAIAPDEYAGFVMACLRMLSLSRAAGGALQPESPQVGQGVMNAGSSSSQTVAAIAPTQTPTPEPQKKTVSPQVTAAQVTTPQLTTPQATTPLATTAQVTTPQLAASQKRALQAQARADDGEDESSFLDSEPEFFSGDEFDGRSEPVFDQADDEDFAQTAPAPRSDTIVLPEDWAEFSAKLPLSGMAAQLARQSECVAISGRTMTLSVATKALSEGAHAERLRAVLTEYFGFVVQVFFEIGQGQGQSAHAVDQAEQAARQQAAEQAVKLDPFVLALVKDFGAQVVPGSIRPGQASR